MIAGLVAAVTLLTGLLVTGQTAAAADLPYGPYTCKPGRVWREAVPADNVCVTPEIRSQTATENALGPSRREPNGGIYGPDTCKPGYVWRETRLSDHVCVPPASRDQARSDNASAPWWLADLGAPPRGGVSVATSLDATLTGGHLYATGSGLTPGGTVQIYAVNVVGIGPYWLGSLTADASGVLQGWQHVAHIDCLWGRRQEFAIGALDLGSGLVTTAGTTNAFLHCS
ncbi:hypothetical protein ACFZB5_32335 [Streptomyces nodosus]|uniref:hypothetical protein n=1 Tax=Streptomyces nodosus TaxID=40318 RepID=UPI0036E6B115